MNLKKKIISGLLVLGLLIPVPLEASPKSSTSKSPNSSSNTTTSSSKPSSSTSKVNLEKAPIKNSTDNKKSGNEPKKGVDLKKKDIDTSNKEKETKKGVDLKKKDIDTSNKDKETKKGVDLKKKDIKETDKSKEKQVDNKKVEDKVKGSVKAPPKDYKVKSRQYGGNTINITNTSPTYYSGYSNRALNYSSGLSIWDYYMLKDIAKSNKFDSLSERDIARALEQQGYSREETDQILRDARREQERKKRVSTGPVGAIIGFGLIIALIALLIFGIKKIISKIRR